MLAIIEFIDFRLFCDIILIRTGAWKYKCRYSAAPMRNILALLAVSMARCVRPAEMISAVHQAIVGDIRGCFTAELKRIREDSLRKDFDRVYSYAVMSYLKLGEHPVSVYLRQLAGSTTRGALAKKEIISNAAVKLSYYYKFDSDVLEDKITNIAINISSDLQRVSAKLLNNEPCRESYYLDLVSSVTLGVMDDDIKIYERRCRNMTAENQEITDELIKFVDSELIRLAAGPGENPAIPLAALPADLPAALPQAVLPAEAAAEVANPPQVAQERAAAPPPAAQERASRP